MDKTSANARALFERALELDPAERGAWLAENCPDRAQRAVIERMLATDAEADARVLDRSFDALLDSIPEPSPEATTPPAGTCVDASLPRASSPKRSHAFSYKRGLRRTA